MQKFDRENFDRYWFYIYLMETILTDGHCLLPCTCKHYNAFKIFWWVKFWLYNSKPLKMTFPCFKILCLAIEVASNT